jgi:hypothetical protein
MEYLVIASGVALAVGFRVVSLIWEFRDTFARPKQVEPNPIWLHEPRLGGSESRDTRSSRP